MSAVHAMDRSYATLREMLRAGSFAPGARLDANRLAEEIGVSMTPVRDALHRLAGERLVEANSGYGFHVPRLSENDLRQLYEWNAAILSMAIRTTQPAALAAAVTDMADTGSVGERASLAFDRVADAAPNAELRIAIRECTARLHPFRMAESSALGATDEELTKLLAVGSGQIQEIRRYHLRRMRAASDILEHRQRRTRSNTL